MKRHIVVAAALLLLHSPANVSGHQAQAMETRASCSGGEVRDSAAKFADNYLNLNAQSTTSTTACGTRAPSSPSSASPAAPPPVLITSTDACDPTRSSASATTVAACDSLAASQIATCDPVLGYRFQATMIQTLRADGTYTSPTLNSVVACNTPDAAPAPLVVTEADFRSLPLTPSTITVGPPHGWIPVTMATIAYTSTAPQTHTTTLLGQPVIIRATPMRYTWDWRDGTPPLTTTDPGAPWPDHTLSHAYPTTGTYAVTMMTTWTGEYSLDGGATYTPIAGTATTTSTAPSLTVHELRTHLVDTLIT